MENSVILIVSEVLLGIALILVLLFNKNILFSSQENTNDTREQSTKNEN